MFGDISMPSPEKFHDTLTEYNVDDLIIKAIDKGFEGILSKTNKLTKAAYFTQALDVMNDLLGTKKTREIFEANGCCKTGARLKASKEFARINDEISLEEKLVKIAKAPYMNMGSPYIDDKGDLVVNAVSYYLDGKYQCACPSISKQPTQPKTKDYCYCCAGHFKFHYELMLNKKLITKEIVSSPLDSEGTKPCVLKFQFDK